MCGHTWRGTHVLALILDPRHRLPPHVAGLPRGQLREADLGEAAGELRVEHEAGLWRELLGLRGGPAGGSKRTS